MRKAPRDPREVFEGFTSDCKTAFGPELEAICLYGSGARGEYVPGHSDINFLVLLSEEGIGQLQKAFPLVAKWGRRAIAIPLFLTRDYIKRSLDAFPLEFLDMKLHHLLVYGESDPLSDLEIDRGDLRLQCEREVKGKLLALREAYVGTRGRPKELSLVISRSINAFAVIFEGLLWLRDRVIPPSRREVFGELCREAGLREEVFLAALAVKEGRVKPSREELMRLFTDYMEEVRRLARWVDQMEAEG